MHPERGNIPPNDFIPLAENTGLIQGLTRYVLEMVCAQMSEWDRVGAEFAHLPVAVNLSARNLLEPDFDEFLEDILASHLIEPDRLELEVTESALIEDPVRSHQMLHKIAGLGVTLAVDDFGTGYTSMSQLEQMPLSTLKIDRSFTQRLADDPAVPRWSRRWSTSPTSSGSRSSPRESRTPTSPPGCASSAATSARDTCGRVR